MFVFLFIGLISCKNNDLRLNEMGGLSSETELIKTIQNDIKMDHINWVLTDGQVINLRTGVSLCWVNDSTLQINTKDGSTVYYIQNMSSMTNILRDLSDKKTREKITIINNTLKND